MNSPKIIEYTNSLKELQILDPRNYTDGNEYFKKYDEFQNECKRKFNIMYDINNTLVNDITLTPDEIEYISKIKLMYETQHLHKIEMCSRELV